MKVAHELLAFVNGKKHVIWDWNGTLLSDVDYAVSTVNVFLNEHGLPLVDRQSYRRVFDFPISKYYRDLGFDFARESFESLCHRYVDKFMDGVWDLPLYPEMKFALTQLHQNGVTQSVLSATDQGNLDKMIHHFSLGSIFSHVFGIGDKMAASKVERGMQLLRTAGVSPDATVIVGDTLHDLEVAEALGIDAVLVSHGHQCPTRLLGRHHQVIVSS